MSGKRHIFSKSSSHSIIHKRLHAAEPWSFPSQLMLCRWLTSLTCVVLQYCRWLTSLTCVVLHHVLVVSVGGLGEVHARHPHGGVSPTSKETELSPRVHQGLPSQPGAKLLSLAVLAIIFLCGCSRCWHGASSSQPHSHTVEQIRTEPVTTGQIYTDSVFHQCLEAGGTGRVITAV